MSAPEKSVTRERHEGIPYDVRATAIGYSADGRPWVLRYFQGGFRDGWGAVGYETDITSTTPIRVMLLVDDMADFIVEHEIVPPRSPRP